MGNKKKKLYQYKVIKNWKELLEFYQNTFTDEKESWVFRGDNPDHEDEDTSHIPENAFRSRLEKDFCRFGIEDTDKRLCIEQKLIREFRRKAQLHTNHRQENWLECLGLMQHYEGPTRMLDWTYSFFAAVYFATNGAKVKFNDEKKYDHRVVWALDNDWLHNRNEKYEYEFIRKTFASDDTNLEHPKNVWPKVFKSEESAEFYRKNYKNDFDNIMIHHLIKTNKDSLVYAVSPYYLNERLSIQRGVLICPSRIDISWGKNLECMLEKERKGKYHLWRIRIEWKKVEVQKEILRRLFDMNISQASLFPDLDGLAKSLRIRIAMPETLGIRK